MDTLPQISLTLPEMPRFDDGMVDMRGLIRTMTESLVNEIMDVQADMMCEDQVKWLALLDTEIDFGRAPASYDAAA